MLVDNLVDNSTAAVRIDIDDIGDLRYFSEKLDDNAAEYLDGWTFPGPSYAMLIVNRLDDVFAKKRWNKDGTENDKADAAKCRRNLSISSTARLFPARPSPDIDNLGGASIR